MQLIKKIKHHLGITLMLCLLLFLSTPAQTQTLDPVAQGTANGRFDALSFLYNIYPTLANNNFVLNPTWTYTDTDTLANQYKSLPDPNYDAAAYNTAYASEIRLSITARAQRDAQEDVASGQAKDLSQTSPHYVSPAYNALYNPLYSATYDNGFYTPARGATDGATATAATPPTIVGVTYPASYIDAYNAAYDKVTIPKIINQIPAQVKAAQDMATQTQPLAQQGMTQNIKGATDIVTFANTAITSANAALTDATTAGQQAAAATTTADLNAALALANQAQNEANAATLNANDAQNLTGGLQTALILTDINNKKASVNTQLTTINSQASAAQTTTTNAKTIADNANNKGIAGASTVSTNAVAILGQVTLILQTAATAQTQANQAATTADIDAVVASVATLQTNADKVTSNAQTILDQANQLPTTAPVITPAVVTPAGPSQLTITDLATVQKDAAALSTALNTTYPATALKKLPATTQTLIKNIDADLATIKTLTAATAQLATITTLGGKFTIYITLGASQKLATPIQTAIKNLSAALPGLVSSLQAPAVTTTTTPTTAQAPTITQLLTTVQNDAKAVTAALPLPIAIAKLPAAAQTLIKNINTDLATIKALTPASVQLAQITTLTKNFAGYAQATTQLSAPAITSIQTLSTALTALKNSGSIK